MSDIGISCGSQVVLCDLPIRFDTYSGCSHDCKYCFARKKSELHKIKSKDCSKQLKAFIRGERTLETEWCDWNIPLHWGGMSDPFQPAERIEGASLKALKIFAETGYPFVVSTKGNVIADERYIDVIKDCNVVLQVSAACSLYNKIEKGAPTFDERVATIKKVAPYVPRVIVRIQPYMIEAHREIMQSLSKMKEAGAYGVIVEGMKFAKPFSGMVKIAGDYCYKSQELKPRYEEIRERAHELGLAFFCGENRLRTMGDDMCCCGIVGLNGFKGTNFNLEHLYNGDVQKPTEKMQEAGSARCFSAIFQTTVGNDMLKKNSFADVMSSKNLFRMYKTAVLGIGESKGDCKERENQEIERTWERIKAKTQEKF